LGIYPAAFGGFSGATRLSPLAFGILKFHATPGAEFEFVAAKLLAATMADQHQLLGAVRAIGESVKQFLLFGFKVIDPFSAIGIVTHFFDRAGLRMMFCHCLSGIVVTA
jgi:hypothetical protein